MVRLRSPEIFQCLVTLPVIARIELRDPCEQGGGRGFPAA